MTLVCTRTRTLIFILSIFSYLFGLTKFHGQSFPNSSSLSTGQGPVNSLDPVWTVSQQWYATDPGSPTTAVPAPTFTPALINNNCAPGAWVAPMAGTNWITGQDANCATNTGAGYRYFRLTLDLPADCNGYSVTNYGSYILEFNGYVDNSIINIYVNGVATGISGGGFAAGTALNITLPGPWQVGTNYVDILIYNTPNGGGSNPYGLLLQAITNAPTDTDGDGVPNVNDLCPCDPGNNPYGCTDPTINNCDINAIRNVMASQNCVELALCSSECSVYFLNKNSMSGSQAQAFANTFGANLVSIQNQAENDCIMYALNNLNDPTVSSIIWIGFNDEAVEGVFEWYDQSPITYTNWAPGEPNNVGPNGEDCTQIYPNGEWNDLPCNSNNAQSIIEFNLCPVINLGPDISICLNDTANIQPAPAILGSSPYDYSWSNGTTTLNNSVSPVTNSTYIITVTDRYNCEVKDTIEVQVLNLPNVTTITDTSICAGESLVFYGYGAQTYAWNNSVTDGVPYTPTNSATYTVVGTDANGCQDSAQVTVTLNPLPPVDAGTSQSICINDSIVLTGSGAISYTWDQGITDGVHFAPSNTATYTVTGIDANGCVNTDSVIITVNPLPNVTAGNDFAICDGDAVTLNGAGANTYIWDQGVSDGIAFIPVNTATYTVIGTDNYGCQNTAQVTVTINPLPMVDAGPDQVVCLGDMVTLSATGANSYIWNWGVTNDVAFSPTNTQTYTVTGTDANGCVNTDQVVVTVNDLPIVFAGADQQICEGDYVVLNGSGAITYTWDQGVINGVSFSPSTTQTYTVTGTDANGCMNTDQVQVTVYPYPTPGFETNSPAQVLITPLEIYNTAQNYTGVMYFLENGLFIGSGDPTTHNFTQSGHYYITQVVNNHMCVDSLTQLVEVEPGAHIFIPNSFTPTPQDGINDVWRPIMTYLNEFELLIFNRWGNLIYQSNDIYEGWNGGYFNDISKPVESGTYVYKIFYRNMNGNNQSIEGFVNVIR